MSLVIETLKRYFKTHGIRILSILEETQQTEVSIHARALFRYYIPTEDAPKFRDALEKEKDSLQEYGIKVIGEGDTATLIVPVSLLKKLTANSSEEASI